MSNLKYFLNNWQSTLDMFYFTVYSVQIFTGKKSFSGTDANIYMTIFGTRGATNKLKFVDHDKSKFEKGQMDSFEICSKNLGELRRIR